MIVLELDVLIEMPVKTKIACHYSNIPTYRVYIKYVISFTASIIIVTVENNKN